MVGGNSEDFQIMLHILLNLGLQAKHHLTEKEKSQVARAMCHDPTIAEEFHVALRFMLYPIRKWNTRHEN